MEESVRNMMMTHDETKRSSLNTFERETLLNRLSEENFDLLVIGGGITGAGIALDAALRGIKVALIEMQDFGAGTSSRSTKLIHGGLRYLKQGEVKLVREVGRERAILFRNAPHLVIPERMLLPIIQGGTYGKFATSIGLWMYDRLAGVVKEERRVMLSKRQTLDCEPLLKEEGLKGGGLYVEYRTDDARLTVEVLKTAVNQGALAINYVQAKDFVYQEGRIVGVQALDVETQQSLTITCKKVVNATGPWVDGIRKLDGSLSGKRLHLTKGVHIVVDQSRFPLRQATYFDVDDGRMVFAIPRDGKTYIGTTDTDYDGDIRDPKMTDEDLHYLIKAANGMFPSIQLKREDVESHWVGLRPLIHEEGKSPSELSRKDEIFRSESGLITIAGGKLTGFRKMAERVVDLVTRELEREYGFTYQACATDQQVLSGGEINGNWSQFLTATIGELQTYGVDKQSAKEVVHRYGRNVEWIIDKLRQLRQKTVVNHSNLPDLLFVELLYTLEHEMVVSAEDFLVRRTGYAYFKANAYANYNAEVKKLVFSLKIRKNKEETL